MIATVVLLVFAVLMGALVMTVGEELVQDIPDQKPSSSTVCLKEPRGDPLKTLQVQFLNGKISRSEYIAKERALIR